MLLQREADRQTDGRTDRGRYNPSGHTASAAAKLVGASHNINCYLRYTRVMPDASLHQSILDLRGVHCGPAKNYRLLGRVRRRSRRTFSTDFEIFRRRFDGVVIYFFNSDFKFFDDASEFSVTFFHVVFIFSSKFMLIFLQ